MCGCAQHRVAMHCSCRPWNSNPCGDSSFFGASTRQSPLTQSRTAVGHKLFQTFCTHDHVPTCRPTRRTPPFCVTESLRQFATWVALDLRYSCSLSIVPRSPTDLHETDNLHLLVSKIWAVLHRTVCYDRCMVLSECTCTLYSIPSFT